MISVFLFSAAAFAADAPAENPPETVKKKQSSRDFPMTDIFSKAAKIEVVADNLEYQKDTKKMIAHGNVVISYQKTKITSDYAEVEQETKNSYAKGHVLIFTNEQLTAEGEEVYYNFDQQTGNFPNGRLTTFPWYGRGKEIRQVRQGVLVVKNARLTTCDLDEPHYELLASKATIYTGEKILAWNVRIVALGATIFWWPYLEIPMDWEIPLQVSTGYNSDMGAFIYTAKGIVISKHLYGKLLADWRSKRGFGGGARLEYDYDWAAKGDLIGYWSQDRRAPNPLDENPYSDRQDRNRDRVTWRHRTNLDPYSQLITRYHHVTDEYFLQDFFEKEFRSDMEQHSFVNLTKNSGRYGIMMHAEKKMNDFESVIERLPEVRFDWKNQPFVKPWLYYESQTSFANLNKTIGYIDYEEAALRTDSYHEWSAPIRWEQITLTPYGGVRGTDYSREMMESTPRFRTALAYGADLRTQYYKTIHTNFDKAGFEINNLRHVLEPSVRLDSVHPNTVRSEDLSYFDNVDLINSNDVVTLGLENRIQTKRMIRGKMRRVDIVSLNTFMSYETHPNIPNQDSDHAFTSFRPELVLRPYEWLQYQLTGRYDMKKNEFLTFNQDIIIWLPQNFRFLFGQRLSQDPQVFTTLNEIDSAHQYIFEVAKTLNPLWEVHGYVRWDAQGSELEEWQIGAQRDLHDFILDFGYNVRNSSIRNNGKELYFNFWMKNFPTFGLRAGRGRASFAPPRIGETVAGANQYFVQSEFFDADYMSQSMPTAK
ncbi:MAG: LptA/OstA family protein [Candidatus Omnitrophica bacterium]|nr:LptA/OstA family protein [Candidatus Omnitrophota bacterium]MDD5671929.1 LptA/OstA family protein [Candidatus Omnitrophota bacterium]